MFLGSMAVAVLVGTSIIYVRSSPIAGGRKAPSPEASQDLVSNLGFVSPTIGWVTLHHVDGPIQYSLFKTTDAGGHWERQLILPVDWGLAWTRFLNARQGLVVARHFESSTRMSSYKLYRTEDGGVSWATSDFPVQAQSPCGGPWVSFVDSAEGWYLEASPCDCEGEGLLLSHTFDGGEHWDELLRVNRTGAPGVDYSRQKLGLSFVDRSHGWIATGGSGAAVLFETIDGGRSWRRAELPEPVGGWTEQANMLTPAFTSDGTGLDVALSYSSGPGGAIQPGSLLLYATYGGGRRWALVRTIDRNQSLGIPVIAPLDGKHWWLARGSRLERTVDGGMTWMAGGRPPAGLAFYEIQPISAQQAWASARGWASCRTYEDCAGRVTGPQDRSVLLRSSDGGGHWTLLRPPKLG